MCRGENSDPQVHSEPKSHPSLPPQNQKTGIQLELEHRNPFRSKGSIVQEDPVLKPFIINGHALSLCSKNVPYQSFHTLVSPKSLKPTTALAGVAQWIECGLQTKRSPVRFPVKAYALVSGQVPSGGCVRGNHTLMFLSLSFSLPLPLRINKIFLKICTKIKKQNKTTQTLD